MKLVEVWQEYDCPHSCDFDLTGEEIVAKGEKFYCSGCGGHHVGGEHGTEQVSLKFDDGGDIRYRPIPANAEEKAALIASIGQEFPDDPLDPYATADEIAAFADRHGLVGTYANEEGVAARVWTVPGQWPLAQFAARTAARAGAYYGDVFAFRACGPIDLIAMPSEKTSLLGDVYFRLSEQALLTKDADQSQRREVAAAVAHAVAHKVTSDAATKCSCIVAAFLADRFCADVSEH